MQNNLPSTLASFPVCYAFCARVKTLRAKLSQEGVLITIPQKQRQDSSFFDFLTKVQNWLLGKKRKIVPRVRFQDGDQISIFGKIYEVKHVRGISNRVLLHENQFLIIRVKPSVSLTPLIHQFLKTILYEKVSVKSAEYASTLGVKISKITIKKMKSRWGSCSSSGKLSYALNLVFASTEMVDYVCAHEVAHLKHMDHSRNFWKCVESLYPEYKKARIWLRENRENIFCYDLS